MLFFVFYGFVNSKHGLVNSLMFLRANLGRFALNFKKLFIMKTRLLLLFALYSSALTFGQISVFEGFESGIPSSWVNNNFSLSPSSCSGVLACTRSLPGVGNNADLTTPIYTKTGSGSITVSCRYKRDNSIGSSFFSLAYFNFTTNTWIGLADVQPSSVACQTLTGTVPASAIPAGANVIFKMSISGLSGSSIFYLDDFTAFENGTLISEYNFNNTYSNINGNTSFSSNGGTSFVLGRDGVTVNGAININNTGTFATIPGLSYGATARTISVWAKFNSLQSGFNFIYHYGTNGSGNGLFVNPTSITHFPMSPNHSVAATTVIDTWYHFVIVYDGVNSKIYRNGALLNSAPKTLNTGTNSNIFRLGLSETGAQGNFQGQLDDLKIYGIALSDAQVLNLYNNNTLSSSNFQSNNLKFNLYPNPATDILNISMETELKSVEIYSLLGQKVLASNKNQMDVSSLSKGMYMVRVEDVEGSVSTQKLIVE